MKDDTVIEANTRALLRAEVAAAQKLMDAARDLRRRAEAQIVQANRAEREAMQVCLDLTRAITQVEAEDRPDNDLARARAKRQAKKVGKGA